MRLNGSWWIQHGTPASSKKILLDKFPIFNHHRLDSPELFPGIWRRGSKLEQILALKKLQGEIERGKKWSFEAKKILSGFFWWFRNRLKPSSDWSKISIENLLSKYEERKKSSLLFRHFFTSSSSSWCKRRNNFLSWLRHGPNQRPHFQEKNWLTNNFTGLAWANILALCT